MVRPGDRAVLGRSESDDEPLRRYDADGVLRLAVEQSRRLTSRQHLQLAPGPPWRLEVLPDAAPSARIRYWGRLHWEDAKPGSRHPLSIERPLAVLLAGVPAYVVTVQSIEHPSATPPAKPEQPALDQPAPGQPVADQPFAEPGQRTTRRTDLESLPVPVTLSRAAVFDLARIFAPALQWPPHPHDDPAPSWTGMAQVGSLRPSYRRVRNAAAGPLHLPANRGPDPALIERLVDTRCLVFTQVAQLAEHAGLPFPPQPAAPGATRRAPRI